MKKVIVIAEAGVNHNGSIQKAKKLILAASKAKADYVKFQFYKTDNIVTKTNKLANYQKKNLGKNISQYNLLKSYELSIFDILRLQKYAKIKKIKFLISVFDVESFDKLIKNNIKEIKIPSGEINNIDLLEKVSKKAKKVFISSGMANYSEISTAIKIFKKNKNLNKNIYLMHCNTDYPTRLNDVNLRIMPILKKKYNVNIGYSDHTITNHVAIAAVALNASVVEKHFTLSRKLNGPDHKASLEPIELKKFVEDIRNAEILLGSKKKIFSAGELLNKKFVRKSIVAKIPISKGEKFSENNIICKRPEGGLEPKFLRRIVGKKAKKNFLKDDFIII